MKRRILAIALTLCMLFSLLPMSALAAETYQLYINNFQFSSTNLTYTSGSGSATYNPSSKTLTIKNLSLSTGAVNTIIESGISGLTIKIDGTLTLNLLASKVVDGVDYGKIRTNYGIAVTADTTICGANNSADKDSIIITSQSTGVDDTEYEDGTTRVGIRPIKGAKLTMKNLTVSMTDNSTGSYAGHASMIRAVDTLNISGCKLVTNKCQFGVFVDNYTPVTITDTVFDMNLNGTLSSGVNFAPNAVNVMQNCSGSISGEYPVYTAGQLTISGGSKLTLVAGNMGMIAAQNQNQTPGKLILDNVNVEIQSEKNGFEAEAGGSITMKSGTVNVTKATYGVQVKENSSFALQGGTLTIRGADTTNCAGIKNSGTVTISGGSLNVDNVYTAIQNDSSTALSITGGEHTLTAATCGYLGDSSSELKISNTAKVTLSAETGIRLSASSNSKLTVSGGELNVNATNRGIELPDSTSAMTLSGGKVNITDKNSTPTIYGIYSVGNTQLTGAEVTFKNCRYDMLVANSNSKMTGGKLHLAGYVSGAQFPFGFEMTGGEIDGSAYAYGIVAAQGTTTLKGGTVNLSAKYPFYMTNGGTLDFAGANVTGKSTSDCGLLVDTDTEGNSYKISGGTVVLTSSHAGASAMYTSMPSNYGVWAGDDEASATLVAAPTETILTNSKYVRFAEKKAVTLTLVDVKEGTSASYLPGESFTYTAKDAPSDQHFSHWELTVGSTTTTVGTDTTYSGKMPAGDATLTAVYENCSGGTATCQKKAVCATCGKEYGKLAAHDFTAEVEEAQYLKTAATCTDAAVYYKSCTGCGASSEGTEFEATFYGEAKGHAWGEWTSNGGGTHSRICGNDAEHKETEDCSGGTATCQQKAVCDFCHAEYGELAAHSYTAEVAEDAYLKDAATCTDAAVYYKSCTGCGASSEGTEFEATFYGEAKGHAWGEWTSNGGGTHTRICGNDAEHKETEDCSGGTATCQQKAVCDFCHAEYGELAAHSYTAEAAEDAYLKDAATCTEAAVYYKSCTGCGTSSQDTEFEAAFSHGDPLGHEEVTDSGHDATCTEDGLTEGKHCSRCQTVLTEQTIIPALGHNVTSGTVTKEPTCTEDGERVGTCERCGATDVTGKMGKLGHHEVTVPGTAPTCAEAGWSDTVSCDRCGEVLQERRPLGPTGHTLVVDAETDTLTKGMHCSVCGKVLVARNSKAGGRWTDDGNYDAALYASAPGNWVISDAEDLAALAKKVNDGNSFEGFTVTLTADIDLSAHLWTPIGLCENDNPTAFSGIFRGSMHTISGMRAYSGNTEFSNNAGLFGYVSNAEITDLLVLGDVYAISKSWMSSFAGGLAGKAVDSTLRNCGFTGTVFTDLNAAEEAHGYTGGLAGYVEGGIVENCFAIANVNAIRVFNPSASYTGGLLGTATSSVTVSNCYTVATVSLKAIYTGYGGYGTLEGGGFEFGDEKHATASNCYTQIASVGTNGSATVLTREQMQSEDGLVELLNAFVSENGNGKDRTWYVDPAVNQGYPTFSLTVSFETGIEGKEATVVCVIPGSTVTPADGTLPGYIFQGWFADEGCTVAFDFSKPITADTTVYGKYAPGVFTITYILNGGENAASNPTEYLYGVGAALADATRENYLFEGWYTDAALTQRITEIGTEQTGDLILFAKWSLDPNHPHIYGACRVGENGLHEQVCEICGKVEACTYTTTVTEPTCTSSGYTTHTCDVCGTSFVDTFVEGGHIWNAVLTEPTHTEMGYTTYTCSRCKESYTSNYVAPIDHSFDDGVVTKEATCTAEGEMLYTCACGETYTVPIAKADHELVATVTEPTCTELGFTTHACKNCDYAYTDTYVSPNGHSFDNGTVTKEPTCTAEGEMLYTCACGETYTAPIAKVDHVLETTVTAPTCTEMGFTTHACKNCDFAYTDTYVSPTGHDWDEGKVASAPTLTETGILVQTCVNCGATKESPIPMLTACDGGNGCPSKAYVDVPDESHWAHVGIDFALKAGLFYGTSETTFAPDATMTRAMLVTVLYRLEGKPATNAENPFKDIADGEWYTDAVVWAAENGIVNGVEASAFDPDGKITREQMAAILYRYTKFKGLPLNDGDYVEEYPDIDKVSPYAAEAMRWANAEGLINGMSNGKTVTLVPDGNATRAQVAAIFMRYVQNVLTK